jgi:hypothetical protein
MMVTLLSIALAASPFSSPVAERHFEQGMRHFSAGDREGALLEFERARAIEPAAPVLFNVAVVASLLGKPLHALEALDALLATQEALPPARLARAKTLHAELSARVGTLVIRVPVEGASVDVDGRPVGRAPLLRPVRVQPGRVLVTALAPRHAPSRAELEVDRGQRREVDLPLEPLERPLAQLTVACEVPGANVFIDGERVALTPVRASLPLVPGPHLVRLTREGYRPAEQRIELREGSTGELGFTLEEDASRLVQASGRVEPRLSETQVLITVNGQRRGTDLPALVLPPGPHVLGFERSGFFPQQHEVMVEAGATTALSVSFEPTPELRADLETQRTGWRRASLVGFALGGAAVVGGAVTFGVLQTTQRDAAVAADAARAKYESIECRLGGQLQQCEDELARADARLRSVTSAQWVGPTLIGVGAGLLVASVLAFVLAPDPARFDRPPSLELAPALGVLVGPGGGALTARWAL